MGPPNYKDNFFVFQAAFFGDCKHLQTIPKRSPANDRSPHLLTFDTV